MWNLYLRPIRDQLPLWLLLLPLLGMVMVALGRRFHESAARQTLCVNVLTSVLLCVWLVAAYEPLKPTPDREQALIFGTVDRFQFRSSFSWIGESRSETLERTLPNGQVSSLEIPIRWGPDIRLEVGVDGISLWLTALSVLLVTVALSVECRSETEVPAIAWLWLEASLIGTFVALDVVLFSICWMSTLLAVAWLMGNYGDIQRHATVPRLMKATAIGVWLVTIGLCGLVLAFGWLRQSPNRPYPPLIFSMPELIAGLGHWTAGGDNLILWANVSPWLFGLLVFGFTGPMLLAPFHRAFVMSISSAPPAVSIVLVGALIKVGLYGWLRFIIPVFPDLLRLNAEFLTTLVGISSLLAAVLAFGQTHWPQRIALATTSSIGLSLLGLMTFTLEGMVGAMLRLLSHSLTAALLLWLLSRSSNSEHQPEVLTKEPHNHPLHNRQRALFRLALCAWIGLPGLSGFVAEFVSPFGLIQHEFNLALLSLTTSGLIAWMWVRADRDEPRWPLTPWTSRDWSVAITLVGLNIALGIAPQFVITRIEPSLVALLPTDRPELTAKAGSRAVTDATVATRK
ncbi:MAG: proton-conducting transporter membrane subunit [Planctomycetia bacterium]|nr:proton-conducting transporter membrane subunit [Planctomycetia bacterium]